MKFPGTASRTVLTALFLSSASFAGPFSPGVKKDDMGTAALAEWYDGAERPLADTSLTGADIVWTDVSQPQWRGIEFGASKKPGARHLRVGFTRSIDVGTILARGGGRVSVLKDDAVYPGDLDDDSQWIPATRIVGAAEVTTEAGADDYAVWTLPKVVATRALRFTHVAEATDKNYAGAIGGCFVLATRFANIASQARVSATHNGQAADKIINGNNDRTWQAWDNWEENAPGEKITADHPEIITLIWPREVSLRALNALWAGFGAAEIQVFAGKADVHPLEAADSAWRSVAVFDQVDPQYPRQLGVNWMDFAANITTRAIRMRITKGPSSGHPHLTNKVKDGRRVWLGELLALTQLGEAPLASAVIAPVKEDSHPPIPVKFTLREAGFVTLVIDGADGKRVRNLISETPFPAGDNVAWWDGMDDLGRDPEAARHGIYHVPGSFVQPGSYRVRGLSYPDISLRYEFPVYTAGNPAWNTEDHTGAWLANHSPPMAALFVPAKRAPGGKPLVYLGSYVSEGTHGLAWVDLDGKKVGGENWVGGNWTGAPFLTRDDGSNAVAGVFAYAGSVWRTEKGKDADAELRITALTTNGSKQLAKQTWGLPASSTGADADVEHEMGGIAAYDGVIAVSLRRLAKVLFIDAGTGKTVRETPVADPRGVAFDRSGNLFALSGTRLLRLTTNQPPSSAGATNLPLVVVFHSIEGLEDPQQVTFDAVGNIFVSDHGTSHQVKMFSPEGKFLRAIGHAGVPQAGAYDREHMNHPCGITVDNLRRLWVAEKDAHPKRVSVWTLDGKLVKAFYGPAEYGGGGQLDSSDATLFHYSGMTFELDWKHGSFELKNVFYRPDEKAMKLGFRNSPPETAIYRKGHRYFANCYNSNPTGGSGTSFLFSERKGVAIPCAGFGRAQEWEVLLGEEFKSRWPADIDPKADKHRNPACFAWSDLNGDGQAQPDEVTIAKTLASGVTVMPDLSFVIARFGSNTLRFAARKFVGDVPVYDLEHGEVVATDVASPKSSGGDQALVDPDGWSVVTLGVAPFSPYSLCGVYKGEAKWSYPSPWPGLHASHEAPAPEFPGEVLGSTRLLGGFIEPRGSDAGPMWCVNGNFGPMYLFTADGLFVKTFFRDVRQGKPWQMPVAVRGMRMDEQSPHDENFWPSITQTKDGKVFLVDGGRSSLIRVDGLDAVHRLPDATVKISEQELSAARAWQMEAETKRQQNDGAKVLSVAMRNAAAVVDGDLGDWTGADWAAVDKRGVKAYFNSNSKPYDVATAVSVADGKLFVAFRTGEEKLLENSGEVPNAPFKTGGALDVMIGSDAKADDKRMKPVAGDLRLLVTRANNKTLALIYRAVVPNTAEKDRVPFSSPWRTIYFDRVEDVSAQVQLAAKDGSYEISIPLAALGLAPVKDTTIRADLGVLRGGGFQTTQRVYWSNKATGITADVPSEAELTPQLWGRWKFEAK